MLYANKLLYKIKYNLLNKIFRKKCSHPDHALLSC